MRIATWRLMASPGCTALRRTWQPLQTDRLVFARRHLTAEHALRSAPRTGACRRVIFCGVAALCAVAVGLVRCNPRPARWLWPGSASLAKRWGGLRRDGCEPGSGVYQKRVRGPLLRHLEQRGLAVVRRIGDHAVVLGGSMGGLLAARVLAEAYQQVTVLDREIGR